MADGELRGDERIRVKRGRERARPEISKRRSRLAAQRLKAEYTQRQMADLTGMSIAMYRRLERLELENPPLRHLVNCVLVLRARLPEIRFVDVFEREWNQWLVLNESAAAPPAAPKRGRYELFPE